MVSDFIGGRGEISCFIWSDNVDVFRFYWRERGHFRLYSWERGYLRLYLEGEWLVSGFIGGRGEMISGFAVAISRHCANVWSNIGPPFPVIWHCAKSRQHPSNFNISI